MGFFATHSCWRHGSYSQFSKWRNGVAKVAGYEVIEHKVHDSSGYYRWEAVDLNWKEDYTNDNLLGIWETPPDDPLFYIIVHHDSEGVIYPRPAAHLARALVELIPLMDDEWVRDKTVTFCKGLIVAVSLNESVIIGAGLKGDDDDDE